jgi:hypothetical protein
MKNCPFCANEILEAAIKCQYCYEMLAPMPANTAATVSIKEIKKRFELQGWWFSLLIAGLTIWAILFFVSFSGGSWKQASPFLVGALLFIPLGRLGWRIGDFIRRFAMPDSMLIGGGLVEMVRAKVFWMVGPQTIGVLAVFVAMCWGAFQLQSGDVQAKSNVGSSVKIGTETNSGTGPDAILNPPNVATNSRANEEEIAPDIDPVGPDEQAYSDVQGAAASVQLDFSGDGQRFEGYRSRILASLSRGANFSLSYNIVEVGCGTGCRFALLVDRSTGQVSELPVGGEDFPNLSLMYSRESSSLEASWNDNSGEQTMCRSQVFRWREPKFEAISTTFKEGECP